nr:reverse transcriptase domain-containing protein [Tanacetum cinerariifolium]
MVPIHHSPDQTVVGATALSLFLDVSHARVQKIKENIENYKSPLRDVFIPLAEPFSTVALRGTRGTSDNVPVTTDTTTALSMVVASTSTVRPISIDDYEVAGTDDQATADGNVADEDANPFPNVDGVESTSAVLSVGMPIFAGMTASVLVSLTTANCQDLRLIALAFFTSTGKVPSVGYLKRGFIQVSPSSSTTANISTSLLDFSFSSSTGTCLLKALRGPELNYTSMKKLVLALVHASTRLKRSENKKTDALSKIASTSFTHLSKQVPVEELKEKSSSEVEILAVVEEEGDTWMTPLFKYLMEGTLPVDVKKARAIRRKFGLPEEIISDNEKQFRDNPFKDWCEKLYIRQHFALVKHPQTNGLVERANRSLREGIKARLDARSKNWMKELPHVLWAHRTMIKTSNRDISFSLTYRMEAVIPAKIGMPTLKTAEVDLVRNNEALAINLDLLEEKREEAAMREAKSKEKK